MKAAPANSDARTWARRWPAVEALFDALDRKLLNGVAPDQVLRLACDLICATFGYPLLVLRGFPGEGREAPLRFAAGAAVDTLEATGALEVDRTVCDGAGITSGVALPVRVAGRAVGHLQIYTNRESGFAVPEVETLSAIARRLAAVFVMSASQHQLRLLATALSSAVNAVFITDAQGRIEWVNVGFCQMTGYGPDEVIGQDPRILKSDVHNEAFFRQVWETIQAGLPWEGEVTERHRDGHLYVVHQTITPIVSNDGRVTHFVAIHEDITRRKQLENELREARDKALGAARLQSEFLANMSHEVRTPMNGVMGMLELLADTQLGPEQRHYLEVAQRSARILVDSLSDILNYSRLEAVGVVLNPADVNLRGLLDELVEMVASGASDKRLELCVLFDPDVPVVVHLDPVRLRQVLLNLISNAIKFTDEGSVVIRVRIEPSTTECLGVEVSDTGIGIAPDAQRRVFEPFQQADGSSTRRFGGSGLGLAICRQIVTAMGGALGVDSQVGIGSTFWFHVRFDSALSTRSPAVPFAGMRLLLIETRPVLRAAIVDLAQALGLEVTAIEGAADAESAIGQAAEKGRPFQAVLLGERIEDAEAAALYRNLKSGWPQLPVVAIAPPGERRLPYGDGDCLRRPLSGRQLEHRLRALAVQNEAGHDGPCVGAGRRILVAEDSVVNQQVAKSMLSRLGFGCVIAKDGKEAIDLVEQQPFDAVLMDCQMPGVDGYGAAGQIRRHERESGRSRIPIIAMTAHARPDEAERCAAADMDGYLPKPLELERLGWTLTHFLETAHKYTATVRAVDSEVLDSGALAQLREVDAEDAASIVDAFLYDTPRRLAELQGAIEEKDWANAARLAHTLKGSGAALGVRKLVGGCARLEVRCKSGGGEAGRLLNQAEEAFQAAMGPLKRFRDALLKQETSREAVAE